MQRDTEAIRGIATAGLVAGILDITDACVFFRWRGVASIRILQSIASGLLGARAYLGGWPTAMLGLMLHFVIAFGAAAVYYAASRKFSFLRNSPLVCGLLYGATIYVFMNYVVVPISAVAKSPQPPATLVLVNGLLAVVLFVGLPIALIARSKVSAERARFRYLTR